MEKVRNMLLLNVGEINKIHLQNSNSNLNEILGGYLSNTCWLTMIFIRQIKKIFILPIC